MLEAMLALVLSALVAGGPAMPPPGPGAVPVVPDEPGAFILPGAPTYQAIAADLDGDGARDLVRTVAADRGAIVAEAWTDSDTGWAELASPVEIVPSRASTGQGNVVYAGSPARLILRRVEGRDRITLVRRPVFRDAGNEPDCCLLLHDLVVADDAMRLVPVADPGPSAGAVSAIDFDGDGTDELLASRSLPPLGDIGFPSEARVYRWAGESFAAPTVTQLPVGSGDTPFVLGDSDGQPGDEAAIMATIGRASLYRLRLTDDDLLVVDDAGVVATDARGVPTADGAMLVIIGPTVGMAAAAWPAGGPLGDPVVTDADVEDAEIIGVVTVLGQPRIVVRRADPEALHLLSVPSLDPSGITVTRSPTAAAFTSSPLRPYVGLLPGGGLDGEPAVLYAGRLLPSPDLPDAAFRTRDTALFATLAGAQPVGLVGRDRRWLAISHAALPFDQLDPVGGRLDAPVFQPGSGVSIAPVDIARLPERDDGSLRPALPDAVTLPRGEVAVGSDGFTAELEAPPGSRVYFSDEDPSVIGPVLVIPESGTASVTMEPPVISGSNYAYRAALSVVTPAGHGYVATWDVRVMVAAPTLEVAASTPFGSPRVVVAGRTAPHAAVTVAGEPVTVDADGRFTSTVPLPPWPSEVRVTATDPVGNQAAATVSGVGIVDYRGLPWPAITISLVALAGAVLFLRVPRLRPAPRRADDAVLEEMEPD